jgi:hypothetical protein
MAPCDLHSEVAGPHGHVEDRSITRDLDCSPALLDDLLVQPAAEEPERAPHH